MPQKKLKKGGYHTIDDRWAYLTQCRLIMLAGLANRVDDLPFVTGCDSILWMGQRNIRAAQQLKDGWNHGWKILSWKTAICWYHNSWDDPKITSWVRCWNILWKTISPGSLHHQRVIFGSPSIPSSRLSSHGGLVRHRWAKGRIHLLPENSGRKLHNVTWDDEGLDAWNPRWINGKPNLLMEKEKMWTEPRTSWVVVCLLTLGQSQMSYCQLITNLTTWAGSKTSFRNHYRFRGWPTQNVSYIIDVFYWFHWFV